MNQRSGMGARGRGAREFWEIPRSGWRDILVRTWRETGDDNLSLLAAGVAFYSFLAFVPMLAAIVLIYGIVAQPSDVARHMGTLMQLLPADAARIVAEQLKTLTDTPVVRSSIGLLVAIALAIYGAMRGATSIITALNVTYGEHETRGIIATTLLSFAFTAGAVLVTLLAMAAIAAMSLIGSLVHLPGWAAPIVTMGLWLLTAVVASGLVALVYRYGPDRRDAKWSWLTPGSVFASVVSLLATLLFGFYVRHFAGYNATYGALGAVVSFLMWLYVVGFVVLLGSELNAEIEHQTARDTTVGAERPLGSRGAAMADHVAGTDEPVAATDAAPKTPFPTDPAEHGPSAVRALIAGHAASKAARRFGGVDVGTLPMTFLTTGMAMVGRRGKGSRAIVFFSVGAVLLWRAQQRDARRYAK